MPRKSDHYGQLRLMARISLWFAAISLAGLLALLVFMLNIDQADGGGGGFALTRAQLPLLATMAGLALATVIGFATGLIVLDSSFRVAGPLHRICLDLERGITEGTVPRIRIRSSDRVQDEARRLEESVRKLYRYHDTLAIALEGATLRVRRGGEGGSDADCPGERVHQLISQVKL